MVRKTLAAVLVLVSGSRSLGQVQLFEGNTLPEASNWNIVQLWCDPTLHVERGSFIAEVDLCDGFPPPGGQDAAYRRELDEYVGVDPFFLEWRIMTDGDSSELIWGGPAGLALASHGGVNYRFSISKDQADLNRDNLLPIPVAYYEAGLPHVFRLELLSDVLYVWYIDGVVIDQGKPEGAFPTFEPFIVWRTKAAWLPNRTEWDYIRYGRLPDDHSGDFDSTQSVTLFDFRYFDECRANSGPDTNAGPGCRWADMDADTDVDLHDFAAFQVAFTSD